MLANFSSAAIIDPPVLHNPMKTPRNKAPGLHLKKSNNRWKWMAGATAATAAGVTASQAGIITINLVDNFISAGGGNHLNADLTGDGHPDITIDNAGTFHFKRPGNSFSDYYAQATLNGVFAKAVNIANGGPAYEILDSKRYDFRYKSEPPTLIGSIPFTFKDLAINNGKLTSGSLEVTVSVLQNGEPQAEIKLDSFTFNTPDNGSSLALLAIGAGGILAFRRRAAQGRS